ncbi:MAG: Efflux ABC transporter, permease protein [Candidatus Fermentimicrarchaeum limneticum]|uniref:Efflux ABC transporter, permease protein n=1 Tax=Fermentimicrarchaeum limneticum TaxID=2795018 RepID=A0A7D5XHD9_FERL1|nr:MAG: Efflux ABC transporter, permease protein [Candidatus Fermentimicrarchaeum limneticum]
MNKQISGIYILWKREVIRFFRAKSRVIGTLGMPFFFLLILGSGFGPAYQAQSGGGNYMDLLTPGIIGMVLLFSSIFSGIRVLMDREFGFLKEIMVAPISRTSIMLGITLGGMTTSTIQAILFLGVSLLVGVHLNLYGLPAALLFMFLISASFVALGIAIASKMEDMHGFQLITNFLIMPLFLLSGALFPLENLGAWQFITFLDPLTYGVDGLRVTLTNAPGMPLWLDFTVLAGFCVVCILTGAFLFSQRE